MTKYTANYDPLPGMTARCAGLHTVTKNQITDNEICLVTDSTHTLVAGTFFATDYFGSWPAFDDPVEHTTVWYSDFGDGELASSWKVVVVPLGHGKFIWLIKAHYPVG